MAKSAGKIHMTRTKELMRAKEQNGPPPPPQKGGSMANFGLLSPYTLPKRRGLMEKSAAHPPPRKLPLSMWAPICREIPTPSNHQENREEPLVNFFPKELGEGVLLAQRTGRMVG